GLAAEVGPVPARVSERAPGPPPGVVWAHVVARHRGGAISTVTGTWARPGTRFRYGFHVAGTDGLLSHDSAADPSLRTDTGAPTDGGGDRLLPDVSLVESPFVAEIREFAAAFRGGPAPRVDRKSTRLNSSHVKISYAVFCLRKKTNHRYKFNSPFILNFVTQHLEHDV